MALNQAIMEACSDESYVSERVVMKFQLPTTPRTIETCGLGGISTMSCDSISSITIQSLTQSDFSKRQKAYVLLKISVIPPSLCLEKTKLQQFSLAKILYEVPVRFLLVQFQTKAFEIGDVCLDIL